MSMRRGAEQNSAPAFDETFRAQLFELLSWRRDVRRFRPDPLPQGVLERLIETACLAPSVGLSQPWRFVTVADLDRREAVRAEFRVCNAEALEQFSTHIDAARTIGVCNRLRVQ